ncbi:MAG: integrase core domain-containing protein, partial [Oscillospiraceae bacterium]|nr:integrase core domain-containing protein [Oscillospiraceae bacterium]
KPVDNCFIETFWKSMKVELGKTSLLTEQTYRMVIEYYVYYYNNLRPPQQLGIYAPACCITVIYFSDFLSKLLRHFCRSKGGDAAIPYGDVAFVVDENMTWIQVGEQIFISEAPGNLKEIATALWASQ